jgi:hypothetical protein
MHPTRGGELRNRAGALAAFIEIVHTVRFDGGRQGEFNDRRLARSGGGGEFAVSKST